MKTGLKHLHFNIFSSNLKRDIIYKSLNNTTLHDDYVYQIYADEALHEAGYDAYVTGINFNY